MKIAVVSDTHNSRDPLKAALDIAREAGAGLVIHCGDIKTGAMFDLFEGFEPYFVLGNADREPEDLIARATERFGEGHIGRTLDLDLAGRRVAVVHGDTDELRLRVHSGDFDYVLHGHTHRRKDERVGSTRIINPGALGGLKREPRSFCMIDLETDGVDFVEIP